jgi:rhodanese-related sulfurtransferase
MKTITPFELQMLIDKRYVEVIDVRPKEDFERVHVLVARSVPLKNFEPHSVLAHRTGKPGAPVYIFAERNAVASLAACGLASAGLSEAIVVDGGLEEWEGRSLPVVRKGSWRNLLQALVRQIDALLARMRELLRSHREAEQWPIAAARET